MQVGADAAKDKKKIHTSNTRINHAGSVQMKFYSCD